MAILSDRPQSKMPVRRVGLSNRQKPPSLLTQHKPPLKIKEPKSFDDPPVSSDDEEDEEDADLGADFRKAISQGRSPSKPKASDKGRNTKKISNFVGSSDSSESSGDGNERVARAGIKRTTFGANKRSETTRETRGKRKESPIRQENGLEDLDSKRRKTGENSRSAPGKASKDNPPPSSGEHLRDTLGFTKIKKSKATYKKRGNSSQEQPVQKEKKASTKLKVPSVLQSPERPKTTKLRLRSSSPSSSPPSQATLKIVSSLESPGGSTTSRRKQQSERLKTFERSPSPPAAIFRMPASISDLQLRTLRSKAADNTTMADDASETEQEDAEAGKPAVDSDAHIPEPEAVCPWCGESVDRKLLDGFAKGRRLNVRLQSTFCQKHKRETAVKVWQEKRYPHVEWDGLEGRFAKFDKQLLDVINGGASHFRTTHEQNIASGRARSMKKEGNMNPGYYGPRGFNLMCDYLVKDFGDLLKKKAVDDRVIAGRGSAAFIQTVLVAELAVQLIMEDMKVAEEEARRILEESKDLGEMIHEEI